MVRRIRSISIGAVLVMMGMASVSFAAFDAAEAKCRAAVAKSFTKAIAQGSKAISGCHKSRSSGKIDLAVDCNILDTANADSKGKFATAQAKLAGNLQKFCIDSAIDLDAMEAYVSCPEPCNTSHALPNPLTSYGDLSSCLACVAGVIAEGHGLATQGLPGSTLAGDDLECAGTIGKTYGKLLSTILKERTKCQNAAEKKDGAMSLADSGCATSDLKLKIEGALTKAQDAVTAACSAADLAAVDSCDTSSVTDLNSCLGTETNDSGDDGVFSSYELPPTICPVGIDSLVLARTSIAKGATDTLLELGWTGVSHRTDVPDNFHFSVDVTCPSSSPPCGTCTIDGVSTADPQSASFLRCSSDLDTPCDQPFVADMDDCGGSICAYVAGPPVPISTGNNPTCIVNRLLSDVTGTSDPDTGAGRIRLSLSSLMYLGVGLTNPCPVCVGDTRPLDGIRNGTCENGGNDGAPCDVMGYSGTFASAANGEGLSLDCPPSQLANVSGAGLRIPLELTTGASSLPFSNSCDSPLGFLDCACGVCTGDTSMPCRNDAECAAAAVGTCRSIGSGVSRVPNECNDGVCSVQSGETGICNSGPQDKFCSGVLDAQGDGFIRCNSDGDCAAVNSSCPDNDCGQCTITRQRACFLDPIDATGTPSTSRPTLVSTFCAPPSNNAAINGGHGLPGPARLSLETLMDMRY